MKLTLLCLPHANAHLDLPPPSNVTHATIASARNERLHPALVLRLNTAASPSMNSLQHTAVTASDSSTPPPLSRSQKDSSRKLQSYHVVKVLSDPAKDLRIVWEIQQRNRELEDEVATLKERVAAMNAGAPLGVPVHLQWPPTIGMGFTGVGEGGIVPPHLGPPPSPQQQQQQTQQPQAPNVPGFGNAAGMLPRADSYAPSNVLFSPFPPTHSPTASFSRPSASATPLPRPTRSSATLALATPVALDGLARWDPA
ncbi:hypothetical protein V500_02780 [Pseudogymnoascus sp. VKM F-4518 (FW-2643)]|nr:hypothetical protein V500_02780 [Pseudogymnoascus sp. VKM F-4518 (FW-2643)]